MSSIYSTISPASLHDLGDHSDNYIPLPRPINNQSSHPHKGPITPESHLLSPYSSHIRSNSASPILNIDTPGDTLLSAECAPSGASSDYASDPFLGANFDSPEDWIIDVPAQDEIGQHTGYPMSPRPTPLIPAHQRFMPSQHTIVDVPNNNFNKGFRAQQEPSINSVNSSQSDLHSTPDTNRGSWSSSNESPAQAMLAIAMAAQSPRVTVSVWGKEDSAPLQGIERTLSIGAESPRTVRPSHSIAGDLAGEQSYEDPTHTTRDLRGNWVPNASTGHRGLAPGERSSDEVPSLNQQAAKRQLDEKNQEVNAWIAQSANSNGEVPSSGGQGSDAKLARTRDDGDDNIPMNEIPFGDATENRYIDGQTYFIVDGQGGPITKTDFDLMRHLRTWGDAPAIHPIQYGDKRYQPESSQAAIDRFHRQCQDNASIISKAATWGTRRRSLPSIVDMEGITSGNFLKKLNISGGGHSRRPSILERVTSISRKTSMSGYRKRKGSSASEIPPENFGEPVDRKDSKDSLAPPSRTSSWGLKKPSTPSLNTVLVGMATSAAVIGTQHARSGSISATPITSPKSPFGSLSVPNIRRARSKSDLPKAYGSDNSHPTNLVGMLMKQGGPPVAQLARSHPQPDPEDEDEDDDDGMDDADFRVEPGRMRIIEPTLNGFKAHVLEMNPGLVARDGVDNPNGFLAERIAYQLLNRYKQLLGAKQKHLNQVNQHNCPSGSSCLAIGGAVKYFDNRGGDRGIDLMSARALSSDEEATPLEGGINAESFPPGIIPPPATSLPAEFECPLCFNVKKFQKPSDWTKHVHEDVQPFTCTWDKCRDPKMFKRKADWVRHENEGHRHLEWWKCDVEDCRHVCYRRDNFLQHLVREHKFTEPKIKTKAAMKKAGGVDNTWQKVEHCHEENRKKSSEEPCRFCGKTFPSWKKLTVHLAKHMEQISLPILDMVLKSNLDSDTIISPVQDPPPRIFGIPPTTPSINVDAQNFSPQIPQVPHVSQASQTAANTIGYPSPNTMGFSPMPHAQAHMRDSYYSPQLPAQPYQNMTAQAGNLMAHPQYNAQQQYHGLPVTATPFVPPSVPYIGMSVPDTEPEPFPAFDDLGIQSMNRGMTYQGLANPVLHNVERYGSNQGSVSPYSHSPHQGLNDQFYNP